MSDVKIKFMGGELSEDAPYSAWDLEEGEVVVARAQVIRLKSGGFAYMSKVTPDGYALEHEGILFAVRGLRDATKSLAASLYRRGKKSWIAAQDARGGS